MSSPSKDQPKPVILRIDPIGEGEWLRLERMTWRDAQGRERDWESVSRLRSQGAVAVAAILRPSQRLLVVRQFRPPAGGFVLEFPAGLNDQNEAPAETALRELHEETGYHGKVLRMLPPCFSSPGMSRESVHLTLIKVDENAPENHKPQPTPEVGEDIAVIAVPLRELGKFLLTAADRGDLLDAKILNFAVGIMASEGVAWGMEKEITTKKPLAKVKFQG
jgi:8-oxo-dGTP pyrophosphatase MutT (NUDIX family)